VSAALLAAAAVLLLGARLRPTPSTRPIAGVHPATARLDKERTRLARAVWRVATRRRPPAADPVELAGWCDALARALRGGDTLHRALRGTAPPGCVAGALAPAMLALERGTSVAAAIDEVDSDSPHLGLVVVVLRACADSGGAAAEPIDRAAAALRQRAALDAERANQSAQARLSAIVMTLLPGAMLLVLLATSGAVRATLLSPLGALLLGTGAVLNLCGWTWMQRIIGGPS
jgi:tight adherence protein B